MVSKDRKTTETAPQSETEIVGNTIETTAIVHACAKPEPQQEAGLTTCQQRKRQRFDEEEETDNSDGESLHSEEGGPSQKIQTKKKGTKRTANVKHVTIEPEVEQHLAEWIQVNPLFYDKCDRYFKDISRKARLMEVKAKEFGLTGAMLKLWYRNMRTVYTRQLNTRPRKSGRLTSRQRWTLQNFSFLKNHICPKSTSRTTDQIFFPKEEVEYDPESGSSVSECPVPSVQTVAYQPTPTQPATILAGAKKGNEKRSSMDDQLYTFMANMAARSKSTLQPTSQQQSSNVRQLFCNYLTAEMDMLTEEQFYSFQAESMGMLSQFRQERQNTL